VLDRVETWRRRNIAFAGGLALVSFLATIWGWGLQRTDPSSFVAALIAACAGIFSFGVLLAEFGAHKKYIETFTFLYFAPFLVGRLVRDEHFAALVPLLLIAAAIFSYVKPVHALSDRLDPWWPGNEIRKWRQR
jgi:hypothetical protein